MKIEEFLIRFVIVFAVTFVVNAFVVYLWNLIVHGQGAFNWGLSVTLAVIVGIVLPVTRAKMSKEKWDPYSKMQLHVIQHIRCELTSLPFWTLLPSVATLYMLERLATLPERCYSFAVC